jgi:predicted lipid-binding transport protein (Tim44 family)
MQCNHVISPREIAAWVLVMLLIVSLISSVVINVFLALRAYRRKPNHPSQDCAVALDNNDPCYEASNVKQTEAQEAMHVYETVKQHN